MFKVGQRVWWTTHKVFGKVVDIKYSENNTPFEWFIDTKGFKGNRFDLDRVKEFHQIADDMFEALGYQKYGLCQNDELTGYQWQDNETFNDHKTRNVMFYKDKTWSIFQDHICKAIVFDRPTIDEFKAIHQKLIELGWFE